MQTRMKKFMSLVLSAVLLAAMALSMTACNSGQTNNDSSAASQSLTDSGSSAQDSTGATVLGEGKTQFSFTVTDADGKETVFEIHTDKKTVGEALLDLELIAGDEGEYGLYVKTVNGVTADYDKDGTYWAFYVDGEYASTGVDTTEIVPGSSYAFKVEKG